MPKKPAKNSFYYFMVNFKEEQRKKGICYANMAEVADAAGPVWRDAPPAVRSKFEAQAKQEKQKCNIVEKFTSTGIPLSHIAQQERELQEAEESERQDIKNFVNLKAFSNHLRGQDIYLMDVNYYCKAGSEYVIGESTLLRFNIQDGIRDTYHEMINPGRIPMGYAFDVKLGREEYALEMIDETGNRSNYIQILANIVDYLKQQDRNAKTLPPIFTLPDKVAPVQDFISQMCRQAGEDETLFRVYKVDLLFFTLVNAFKSADNEGFPKESLAMIQLKKDEFKYSPGIGCEHHEETDKAIECTMSRVKRWAYTILDSCCGPADVTVVPGKHLPHDFDLEGIQVYQEQKKGRLATSIAGCDVALSSCNTSVMSEYDDSYNTTVASSKREERVHVPLRMPKADYSQAIRRAPELTETDFPSFPIKAGRGRGMGGFNKPK